jgi:hypothetical protein
VTSGTGATGLGREVLRILGDRVLVEPGLNNLSGTLHRDVRGRTCRALPGRWLMNLLLLSALIGGLLQTALHSAVVEPQPHSDESTPLAGVAVVADGSRKWGSSASSVLETLRSQLGPSRPVYVIRFDTDGQYHGPGADGDAIHAPSDTPMKDVIILALEHVSRASRIDSMVVIAHEQISPTYVRTDQLLSRMVRAEVPVHTVHLTRANDKRSPLRRSGEAVVRGLAWLVEALMEEDRESYSASDTGRMLQRISAETGGQACVASDEETGARCAETIAVSINESS